MRYIYKLFRENIDNFEEIFYNRFNFETTNRLPFEIKPLNNIRTYQLYYLPTDYITRKINDIYKKDRYLHSLFRKLPNVAKDNFMFDSLVEELQNTNDLEGVRSSKEEIVRSAREIKMNRKQKRRFASMINSYNRLLSGEAKVLDKPDDIRKIYDYLVLEEIEANEKPDGKTFRKETTHVLKKSGSGKVIHQGVTPEEKIIELTRDLINFLKEDMDTPQLIKIAIAHYYFGYIHPFYDGNGRTSRYISSVYLSKELSPLTAISLSRGCNNYRNKYLKAFETANSVANRGEMNSFIEAFLDLLNDAQDEMIEELKAKREQLNSLVDKIKNDELLSNNKLEEVMFILAQNHFFSVGERGLTVKTLAHEMEKSEQFVRKVLQELLDNELIKVEGQRPKKYIISNTYFS